MQRFTLLLFTLLVATGLSAQTFDIPETHRPLIGKRTATWCSNCGSWGWSLFRGLIEDNADNAEFMALHVSGNLKTDVATEISTNFESVGQPVFTFDGIDVNATSGNIAAKRTELMAEINEANTMTAEGNTGILLTREGDELTIQTKTRFFEAANGEYFEAVYLVEKTRIAQQSGQGSDAEHKQLLREALEDNTFGRQVADGAVAADFETEVASRTFDLTDYDPTNLRIVTVLWVRIIGDTYLPVNTNGVDVSSATTGTYNVPLRVATLEARPSVTTAQTAISLIVSAPTTARLELVDAQGRVTELLEAQRYSPGRLWIPLDLSSHPAGTYFVRLIGVDGTATTTVVRQ